jgi:hypothetical protein
MRDADLGQLADIGGAGRRVQRAPTGRRRLRAVGIVGVDVPAGDLDVEVRLNRLGHLGGGLEAR